MDQSVTCRCGIIISKCHVSTRYSWFGVSHSDTIFLDRGVTFRHDSLESECHFLTRYNWIGVSPSDMIILKEKHFELTKCTRFERTQFPKWFGWRHESSWTILILLTYQILALVLSTLVHVDFFNHMLSCIVEFILLFIVY